MPDHYYTAQPQSDHKPARFEVPYRGYTLLFETDSGVFSRLEMDRGTEVLLHTLPENMTGAVLDMGCGYGALGVSLARANPDCRLTMADINERAVALAAVNAQANGVTAETLVSNGFAALQDKRFDWIVTNPPIRAGKKVIYQMFADSANALTPNGSLILVIRKQQGAPSAQAYLQTLFTQVERSDRASGYWVLRCTSPRGSTIQSEPHFNESDKDHAVQ